MTSQGAHRPPDSEPRIGASVFTSDGNELGTVKELSGDSFKVDAAGKPDYWLDVDCLLENTAGRITVDFSSDELKDRQHKVPAGAGRRPGSWQSPPHQGEPTAPDSPPRSADADMLGVPYQARNERGT